MHNTFKNLYKNEKGQAMIEYGLIVAFISIAVIGSLFFLGGKDGGGTCEEKGNNSVISFIDYTYTPQGDTGLYSLYRNVTCRLGGWSEKVVFKDKYESQEEANILGFLFDDTNQTAIFDYIGTEKDIKIPNYVGITHANGKKTSGEVNLIRPNAFLNKGLTSVILPDTLTMILNNSFKSNKLKSIEIPENVKSISSGAFEDNELTHVKFSEGVNLKIDKFAFANNNIKSITIPYNVYKIENQAFDGNPDLREITINDRVGALIFQVNGTAPESGWTTGTYKYENKAWVPK